MNQGVVFFDLQRLSFADFVKTGTVCANIIGEERCQEIMHSEGRGANSRMTCVVEEAMRVLCNVVE